MKNVSKFGQEAETFMTTVLGAKETPCKDALKIPGTPNTYVYFENPKFPGRLRVQFNWRTVGGGPATTMKELQDKLLHAKVEYENLIKVRATLKESPALANTLLRTASTPKKVPEMGTPQMVAEGIRCGIENAKDLTYWRLYWAIQYANPYNEWKYKAVRADKIVSYRAKWTPVSMEQYSASFPQKSVLPVPTVVAPVEKTAIDIGKLTQDIVAQVTPIVLKNVLANL